MSAVDKMISTAKQKLTVLIQAVSKMDVTPEIKANAYLFYHQILATTMRDNYEDDIVLEGGLYICNAKYSSTNIGPIVSNLTTL